MEAALAARGGAWGIEYQRHGGSGISCKGGGEGGMRGGVPLSYRGSEGDPPGKIWEIMVPEKHF